MREIYQDQFWYAIREWCIGCKSILEIGGATGEGSTTAFEDEAGRGAIVTSIEAAPDRFEVLRRVPYVHALNGSSVNPEDYLTEAQVMQCCESYPCTMSPENLEEVLGWRRGELSIIDHLPKNLVHGLSPDFVLIDGSPFTADAELSKVIPSVQVVALDDVLDIKNWRNWNRLIASQEWKLVWGNLALRNGAAIFKRV